MKTNEVVANAMDNAMMLQEQMPQRLLYFLLVVGAIVLLMWTMGFFINIDEHPNKKHISDNQKNKD